MPTRAGGAERLGLRAPGGRASCIGRIASWFADQTTSQPQQELTGSETRLDEKVAPLTHLGRPGMKGNLVTGEHARTTEVVVEQIHSRVLLDVGEAHAPKNEKDGGCAAVSGLSLPRS